MIQKKHLYTAVKLFVLLMLIFSCKKFLDESPDRSRVVITKLSDLQAILDNQSISSSYFALATGAADEYYFPKETWEAKSNDQRDAYIWKADTDIDAWQQPYQIVFQCNVVLSELENLAGQIDEKNKIKGQALFHRAFAFYNIAQLYCLPYANAYLNSPGIVLRTTPLISVKAERSTVGESYNKIVTDLTEAADLLSLKKETANRPYMVSTYGILSRVYLSMRDYENANKYAELYLKESNELTDFNSLDTTANPSIPLKNIETTYYSFMEQGFPSEEGLVDTILYNSYDSNDLRKAIYFFDPGDGTRVFKGSYSGFYGNLTFCGIATDEIYLIKAECEARAGNIAQAMSKLNDLLEKRWVTNTYVDLSASTPAEALNIILIERRKELVYRSTRWTDIRRLNLEGRNITMRRVIGDQVYELPANDNRIAWLIPNSVISISGIEQNKR